MLRIFCIALILILPPTVTFARDNTDPIPPKEPVSACRFDEDKELPENLFGTWSSPGGYLTFKKNGEATSKGLGPNGKSLKEKYRIICIKDGIVHLLLGFKPPGSKEYIYDYTNLTPTLYGSFILWKSFTIKESTAIKMPDRELFFKFQEYKKNQKEFPDCDNATCKNGMEGENIYWKNK